MNHKKQFSEQPWVENEMRALRAETPDEAAVERTVRAMQGSHAARPVTSKAWVWRASAVAAAALALGIFLAVKPQNASAASLRQIADAVRAANARHELVYRPGAGGKLELKLETWIEGEKNKVIEHSTEFGTVVAGYDGQRQFKYLPTEGGFIDDTGPMGFPVESVDSYLTIPGATVLRNENGVNLDGTKLNLLTVDCKNVKFDIYYDAATRLPMRRDVFTMKGDLIEQNRYDYPKDILDTVFAPPTGPNVNLTDYPAVRKLLAEKLSGAGQTAEVGGVKIKLLAVLVGKSEVIAVWTGGALADPLKKKFMVVGGLKSVVPWPSTPPAFAIPSPVQYTTSIEQPPIYAGNTRLHGDVAWLKDTSSLKGSFTLEVPVWAEDRTEPWKGEKGEDLGFRSKCVGMARFTVTDAIKADDPTRVLWKPVGGVDKKAESVKQ